MRAVLALTPLLLVALYSGIASGQTPASVVEIPEEIILQFIVEPGKVECLYQTVTNPKHVSLEIDYQVTEGGEMDINFLVKNPRNVQILYDTKKREGNHRIKVADASNGYGDYAFCFDNSFSMQTKKHVFFEIFLLDKDDNYLNNYDMTGSKELTSVTGFERITTKVKSNMNEIEKLQRDFRAIEGRDRSLMEASYERVNFWSAVNLLFILGILSVQLLSIRCLFIENSAIGRILRKGRLND